MSRRAQPMYPRSLMSHGREAKQDIEQRRKGVQEMGERKEGRGESSAWSKRWRENVQKRREGPSI